MRSLGTMLLLVASLTANGCGSQSPQPHEILDKAIKAHGGEAKLKRAGMGRTKGTTKDRDVNITWEETYWIPGRFRKQMLGSYFGKSTDNLYVQNDEQSWSKDHGGEVVAAPSKWESGGVFASILYLPIAHEMWGDLAVVTVPKSGGPKRITLRSEKADLFFDMATGLLAGYSTSFLAKSGNQPRMEVFYSEFTAVDGVTMPFKIAVTLNGSLVHTHHLTEVRFLEAVDPKLFAKPE